MNIYFSEKFKQLRKKSDLTQEQLAEIFHVSPQSVSRWENGANYPDVEMLPYIAIFFKVTIDELLGTKEINGEEKAKTYKKDIRNSLNCGRIPDAIDLARKATREYPFNIDLHYLLVQALNIACPEQDSGGEAKQYRDEIISLCERMIKLSDYKSSLCHRMQLIELYAKWDMKEEARRVLDTLPDEIWHTKEPWSGLILDGEEWRKNQQHRIIRTRYYLDYLINGYVSKATLSVSQKIEYRKALLQIECLIDKIGYDNSDDEINHLELSLDYIIIAELYCEAGDYENAQDYVEKATQHSMYHIDVMDHTNEDGSNYCAWPTSCNLCWIIWEDYLSKPQFDIIRNSERFEKCFEVLKTNSKALK